MTKDTDNLEKKAIDLLEAATGQNSLSPVEWINSQNNVSKAVKSRALTLLGFIDKNPKVIQTGQAPILGHENTPMPERIGAYKIIKLIGEGGMGTVYKGERDSGDFKLDVAIKLIKPSILSQNLIERFEHERQILAGISHPNIARLYDGGTMTNGEPYFIMEYIDGDSITIWANQNNLNLDARLSLFKSACGAISYAHQNLIIHRDITPNNVLITKNGDVKLIDFGIAKPNTDSTQLVEQGKSLNSLSFTPGFAAPERSKGAVANTLSDIYSLGKLLKVLIQDHNPSIELSAIVTKATQATPEDRYITVDGLMEDIRCYEAGYPVKAHKASSFYAIKKFVSRQKAAVSLGVLAVTGLLGGLITTSALYSQAEAARIQADTRFSEVRSIANFMLYELYDELKETPGNTKALEKIANQSSQYLSRLNEIKTDDFDLTMDTIRGYHRLADITGNPFITNLGYASEASNIYIETQKQLDILLKEYPENPRVLRELADLLYSRASLAYNNEDAYEKANIYIDEALQYISEIGDITPLSLRDKLLRNQLIKLKGSCIFALNRGEEAIDFFKAAEEDILALLSENSQDVRAQRSVAEYYHIYAHTLAWHVYNIDTDDALPLPLYKEAVDRYMNIINANPKWIDAKAGLALILARRAETYMELSDIESALKDNLNAEALIKDARVFSPEDQYIKTVYGIIQGGLINIWAEQGKKDEIVKAVPEYINIQREDVLKNPGDIGSIQLLANKLQISGEALFDTGMKEQGCLYIREALQHITEFTNKSPLVSEGDVKNILIPAQEMNAKCIQ